MLSSKKQSSQRAPREHYVNAKQLEFLQSPAKRKGLVGGRGSGKTTTLGIHNRLCANYLPRAKRFLAGLTYNQLLTKTLPSAMDAWSQIGLKEYNKKEKKPAGHYVVCTRPPEDWVKPYQVPRNYENIITFINGYTLELLSMDRGGDTARGGNYDGGDIDEAALMKKEVISKVLRPSIRGNKHRFSHPLFQSFTYYTSAAWLPAGQWVYDFEELMKEKPLQYYYQEATAYDNLEVLGEEYILDLQQEMSKLEFDVEVLNKRLRKLPNCFYPAFSAEKHARFNTFYYQYDDAAGLWLSTNNDTDSSRPLETSWDFNAAFTSMIVCQEHGREFRVVNALYVKQSNTNLVDALCELFVSTYASHKCKELIIYGDRNGNNRNPGNDKTYYQQIQDKLIKAGWKVKLMELGLDPDHRLKHLVINEILGETNPRLPIVRLNQNTCKYVIISIESTPILPDWKKDKRNESQLIAQERATHLSDCFDNILYRKYAARFGQAIPYKVRFLGR